jgi:transcriptional regulator with XRE-family HTH domain
LLWLHTNNGLCWWKLGYQQRQKPSIEVAAKIAEELGVTVDYLLGNSDNMVMDKKLIKRIEDIEALPVEEKDKVYYFIDMALSHHKAKKAFAK